VIIATGATANWLGLENELRLAQIGGGVSAPAPCATAPSPCSGPAARRRRRRRHRDGRGDLPHQVRVSKVYVIHRRDELRASKVMQERFLSKPNAEVLWNKVVVDVLGDDNDRPASR
jgi:thioredoxin reductase (NADPH)